MARCRLTGAGKSVDILHGDRTGLRSWDLKRLPVPASYLSPTREIFFDKNISGVLTFTLNNSKMEVDKSLGGCPIFSLQVLRGEQGVHSYYTATMSWGEIAQLIVYPEELRSELDEEREMQRSLAKKRVSALVDYLAEDDHFFSAMTFVLLPRDLNKPVHRDDARYESLAKVDGSYGVLKLSGNVRLFPADGQHRARAGVQMLGTGSKACSDRVPVVLIPYVEHDQVRQLFSDLNLNAKPVNKTIGYAFDSRDPINNLAKDVIADVPLFRKRVNRRTNSLARTSAHVITLNALVEGTRVMLEAFAKRAGISLARLSGLERGKVELVQAWTTVVGAFPEWGHVLSGSIAPGALRDQFVFPHVFGWATLTGVAARAIASADDWAGVYTAAVKGIDWTRGTNDLGPGVTNGRINNTSSTVNSAIDAVSLRLKASRGSVVVRDLSLN